MIIRAGGQEIEVIGIYGSTSRHNGMPVDSFRVSLPGRITEEQLQAMLQNPWEICDERGILQSVQTGINCIQEYSLTFLKVPEQADLQNRLQHAEEMAVMYKAALKGAGIDPDGESFLAALKKAQAGQ